MNFPVYKKKEIGDSRQLRDRSGDEHYWRNMHECDLCMCGALIEERIFVP
jgi:hypothetical protein